MRAIDVPAPRVTPATATTLAGFAAANTVGLTRFAYLLCGDGGLAEDLVQDAYLQLYRRFGDDLPIDAPIAYARKILVNRAVSRSRRRASREVVLAEPPDHAIPEGGGAVLPDQDSTWRALATLPERQRAVLVLRYYLDLPDREISALLGCREGTVRSLAARAFAALRTHPDLHRGEDHR